MASISIGGGGHGGKKSVDAEIPLVPFIDLLLCCIMFLLVTAVWNQLASVAANLDTPGRPESTVDHVDLHVPLTVRVTQGGYHLSSAAGDALDVPLGASGEHDVDALVAQLRARRDLDPGARVALVTADDGVTYAHLVRAMDALTGTGFTEVTITGG